MARNRSEKVTPRIIEMREFAELCEKNDAWSRTKRAPTWSQLPQDVRDEIIAVGISHYSAMPGYIFGKYGRG